MNVNKYPQLRPVGGVGMFTTAMHCSSIIFELLPYSDAFVCRPLRLFGI